MKDKLSGLGTTRLRHIALLLAPTMGVTIMVGLVILMLLLIKPNI